MTQLHHQPLDIRAIEQHASALRAEATAAAFRACGTWIRSRLHMGKGHAIG